MSAFKYSLYDYPVPVITLHGVPVAKLRGDTLVALFMPNAPLRKTPAKTMLEAARWHRAHKAELAPTSLAY